MNKNIIVLLLLLIGLGSFFVFFEILAPPPAPGEYLEGELTDVQEKTIDLKIELSRLFMSWSIAVIGAVGYYLQLRTDGSNLLTRVQLLMVELVILLLILSIYFGHLAIFSLIESLSLGVISLIEGPHLLYESVQYILFLFALIVFGGFIHLVHWK